MRTTEANITRKSAIKAKANREANAKADMVMKYIEKVKRRKKADLTFDEMDLIEKWWKDQHRTRRLALLMLTKPFRELDKKVRTDRKFALNTAQVLECLDPGQYEEVTNLIGRAQIHLIAALSGREDMNELMVEAKKQIEII